ncbi:MAG: helix-turn-helix domain-containing protein [bacterium]
MSRPEIARIIDVHYGTVTDWIRRYEQEGLAALKIGQRGRRSGDGHQLTAPQERKLKEILIG